MVNPRPLTPHIMTCYTHKMAIVRWPQFVVTSLHPMYYRPLAREERVERRFRECGCVRWISLSPAIQSTGSERTGSTCLQITEQVAAVTAAIDRIVAARRNRDHCGIEAAVRLSRLLHCIARCIQGGYIFYAGGSLAGAGYCRHCRRRRPSYHSSCGTVVRSVWKFPPNDFQE